MAGFNISVDDKPHLSKMMKENPQLAKEVIGTFVAMMEEACDPAKGITWAEAPRKLDPDLSFKELISGLLRGSLDMKDFSTEFDVLKEEVHPLAFLKPRTDPLGGLQFIDWRQKFRLNRNTPLNADLIASIVRTFWVYGKYVDIRALAEAIQSNETMVFRGYKQDHAGLLPMFPAMRYQEQHNTVDFVGMFWDDVPFLNCGELAGDDATSCPSCLREGLQNIEQYRVCFSCAAGFKTKSLG